MRNLPGQRHRVARVVVTAVMAGAIGFVVASAPPALATGAPTCDDTGLVSDPAHPLDNHDGTTSIVLLGSSDTATATVAIPAGVQVAHLDVCGAQGTSTANFVTTSDGGKGGRTTATITVTGGSNLLLLAGGTASGGAAGAGGGAGGGFSAVYLGTTASRAAAIVYAGGGGGAGGSEASSPLDGDGGAGGAGGGTQAGDGQPGLASQSGAQTGVPGSGASETAAGQGGVAAAPADSGSNGSQDTGGAGGTGAGTTNGGGGGGSGWFGGGGGAGGDAPDPLDNDGGGGGGGGSGHVSSVAGAHDGSTTANIRLGAGAVVLTYDIPSAPTFGAGFTDTVAVGTPYSRTITVSAVDTATITLDSGTLPHGVTFHDNGNNSATLAGTPDVPGHYPFTLRASNGAPPDATQGYAIDVVTPGATSPPTASPSASASPTATPTATTTATPTVTTGPVRVTLRTRTPDIQPNQPGLLDVTGAGDSSVDLRCYTRPSTTYFTARTAQSSGGSLQFRILPGANTRCYARLSGDDASASGSVVINVHTTLSLSAYRDGVRKYHFQGTNLPRRSGQLITLYRWARRDTNGYCDPHIAAGDYTATSSDPNCVAVRTATATTNASNVWRIDRSFTGSGQFVFQVRTSQTLNNGAGVSNPRLTIIH